MSPNLNPREARGRAREGGSGAGKTSNFSAAGAVRGWDAASGPLAARSRPRSRGAPVGRRSARRAGGTQQFGP
ncbi:hypothetical protein A33M_2410 [Rhodovulum sp. PH10]|nr:hypothetical protein A33M_2410 [Rhodovulum sp. PH10]